MNQNPLLAELMVAHYGADINKLPLFTDKLYSMLTDNLLQVPREQYKEFIEQVDEQYQTMKKIVNQISQVHPVHKRVALFHYLLESDLNDAKKESKCKRGCSFCCHLNVDVTADEGRVLRHLWKKQGLERVKKQAKIKDSYEHPYELSYEDSACAFLENGECSIYDQRPASCRTHYSASEPELCDPVKNPRGMVQLFVSNKIEMLKTLMYERYGCAPMAKELLK